LSLRDLIKRVFSDRSTVEGAKFIFACAASGQALTFVSMILSKEFNFEANEKIELYSIIYTEQKMKSFDQKRQNA